MDGKEPLACPFCLASIATGDGGWSCTRCKRRFRSLRGIPDLRTSDDAYLPNDADWSFARKLDAAFDSLDFHDLLERYFDLAGELSPAQRRRQRAHIETAPARARQWLEQLGALPAGGRLLDLGCGSGSFLAAVAQEHPAAIGCDIAMRWLLVARKRLDEAGLGTIPLVCGCAERLPVRSGSIAAIVAGDVIEHVSDQGATLAEAHRVLVPGGRIFLASPNRFSLAPEPHVGVWGVGFLPRRWMAPYVRTMSGLDFRAIRTLSLSEWRRLLRQSPFGRGRVHAPRLPQSDLAGFGRLKRVLGRWYNRLVGCAAGQALALRFGPLFHVNCAKRASAAPPPSAPAIRQRSRRTEARA